jgi:hypothetical protein
MAMPSYVELVNVRIANPTIPPPVPIGSAAAGNATVAASVANQPAQVFQIPLGLQLGGNVQPPPAVQPPVPPPDPPVLVLSSGAFPAGVLPAGITPVIAPSLFAGPNAQLGAPGVPFELCFFNPATGQGDRVHLGPSTPMGCPGPSFTDTGTFAPTTGRAIRWIYVDSNTDIDFDPALAISPGAVNPQMAHVNGLFFGTATSPALAGTPLVLGGAATAGTLSFPAGAQVRSVHFVNAFFDRIITNPAFDPVVNAPVTMTAAFTAQAPTTSPANFLPGMQIVNETMSIQVTTPLGSGTLEMPMGVSTQVGQSIGQSAASPTDVRPERIFTDMITDSGAFTTGTGTGVTIDIIPGSTGGGNTWCEIIVYDYQGNQYRAKVKNWPPGGTCAGPLLGLGTDLAGSFTLINLCHTPAGKVANLFSGTPAVSCGGALFPAGGICPDAVTVWILTPPQLGAAPFFVTADAAGMHLYQVATGTFASLAGMTYEGIAIEYTAGGIVQVSGVNSITF